MHREKFLDMIIRLKPIRFLQKRKYPSWSVWEVSLRLESSLDYKLRVSRSLCAIRVFVKYVKLILILAMLQKNWKITLAMATVHTSKAKQKSLLNTSDAHVLLNYCKDRLVDHSQSRKCNLRATSAALAWLPVYRNQGKLLFTDRILTLCLHVSGSCLLQGKDDDVP